MESQNEQRHLGNLHIRKLNEVIQASELIAGWLRVEQTGMSMEWKHNRAMPRGLPRSTRTAAWHNPATRIPTGQNPMGRTIRGKQRHMTAMLALHYYINFATREIHEPRLRTSDVDDDILTGNTFGTAFSWFHAQCFCGQTFRYVTTDGLTMYPSMCAVAPRTFIYWPG